MARCRKPDKSTCILTYKLGLYPVFYRIPVQAPRLAVPCPSTAQALFMLHLPERVPDGQISGQRNGLDLVGHEPGRSEYRILDGTMGWSCGRAVSSALFSSACLGEVLCGGISLDKKDNGISCVSHHCPQSVSHAVRIRSCVDTEPSSLQKSSIKRFVSDANVDGSGRCQLTNGFRH
jgi:hypothetical protein